MVPRAGQDKRQPEECYAGEPEAEICPYGGKRGFIISPLNRGFARAVAASDQPARLINADSSKNNKD